MRVVLLLLSLLPALAFADTLVCFVPTPPGQNESCTDIVVAQLAAAETSLYIQAYSFTSKPIEQAIVDAFNRGVHVEVILDRSNVGYKYSGLSVLEAAKVPVTIDYTHAIAHNKVMVIDEATVIGGSFNYTTAAQKHNAENLIVLSDPTLAALYLINWRTHRAHSKLP